MDKRTNKLDIRSMPGILARGKTLYGNGTSPNPTGKNQSKKTDHSSKDSAANLINTEMLQKAARKRLGQSG